jgi:lipopolysaccharide transport system ATP-binding protein
LIVDEVLGAGDAYFSSKSAIRMKRLTSQGVTLLLVSHSNAQILQFCDRAVWIEEGRVVADGLALEVVKKYDAFIRDMESLKLGKENLNPLHSTKEVLLETYLDSQKAALSRWSGSGELKIRSVRFLDLNDVERTVFNTGATCKFSLTVEKLSAVPCDFKVVFYVFSSDGKPLLLFTSEKLNFAQSSATSMEVIMTLPSVQLGTGEYVVSAALYSNLDYNDIGSAKFYDLVDRSYKFKVYNQFEADGSQFVHPCTWDTRKARN